MKTIQEILDNYAEYKTFLEDRMSDQENIQTFETDTPVTWETIKFGRDKIRAVKEATGKTPTHLVRAVETMQREYDEQTGFTQCQLESHTFAIKLKGLFNKGRFIADVLIRRILLIGKV